MSRRAPAARFGVGPSTVVGLMRHRKETGSCEARPQGGDRGSARIEAHAAHSLALVDATPDMALVESVEHLQAVHGETGPQPR